MKNRAAEFSRFVLVGALRSILGIVMILGLYNLCGVNYVVSNAVVYSIGLVVGFILHKTWAFRSRTDWRTELIPYAVIFGISYGVNMALLLFCAEKLGIDKNISQIIATAGFTLTNYWGNRFWTFGGAGRESGPHPGDPDAA